jgi:predicted regulator of Ras-like GTPase activity (Roadblock/LC7/MglB family)
MADIDTVLDAIAGIDGVKATVIAGRDGLMIQGSQRSGGQEDLDALAAISADVVRNLRTLGSDMGRSGLDQVIAEFGDGMVLLQPVGEDASLAVMAGTDGNLGRLRFIVRRRAPELAQLLSQM